MFIPGLGYLSNAQGALADEVRLLYVAMTRASEMLVLTGDFRSVFVERLKEALAGVRIAVVLWRLVFCCKTDGLIGDRCPTIRSFSGYGEID